MTRAGFAPDAPDDCRSIDGIITALYASISGPAGARDWRRQRRLFLPGARMIANTPREDGTVDVELLDADTYERVRAPVFIEQSFYESEVARRTERFGCVAHVFSTYESRSTPDAAPFMRGVNSIQLLFAEGRWWIVSAAWQHEGARARIPERYLRNAEQEPALGNP
jgi:hypothetical protein